VTSFGSSTTPGQLSPDTLPGNIPSQPNVGLWSDSDVGLPQGPATAFVTNRASPTDDQMPTIGHIGRYALKYRIGSGGLGTVYAAYDPLLSRLIAIKTLNLELSADERESFNRLFLDEARAAGGLSHPHIVTVFDAGVSDNSAYIAMEMLKGRDLRQLRQEGWRPTAAQAALIVRRVADALAYAHSKGVVHRDIKPANIFMVGRTQPRVLDFGIARVAHRHEMSAGDEVAAGSPYYMAPEQARHQAVDRRADVFSLGVVLYELLTDCKPFDGAGLPEITRAVLTHEPPLASEVDRKVPRALAEIAARAMLKDPEQRYRSARAFSRDLRHWLEDNAANPSMADSAAGVLPESRRSWLKASLAALVIGAVGVIALLAARQWVGRVPAATNPGVEATASAPAAAAAGATAAAPGDTPTPAPASPTVVSAGVPAARSAASATATSASPASSPPALAAAAQIANTSPVAVPAQTAVAPKAAARPAARPAPTRSAVAPKSSAAARPAGEVREPEVKPASAPAPAVAKPNGTLKIAISPWGQVEVDGVAAGTAPPLNEMTLPEGRHQIVIRNGDFPPLRTTITVTPGQPVTIKHKFGS
jgi:hypothetical protein